MNSNVSVQFHLRLVTERHNELIQSLNELVKVLVSENVGNKKTSAQVSLQKSNDLKIAVSSQDCPDWLPSLIAGLSNFINSGWSSANLMELLINIVPIVKVHTWVFQKQSETAFDFDSIF